MIKKDEEKIVDFKENKIFEYRLCSAASGGFDVNLQQSN